jgi:hypothetical protein
LCVSIIDESSLLCILRRHSKCYIRAIYPVCRDNFSLVSKRYSEDNAHMSEEPNDAEKPAEAPLVNAPQNGTANPEPKSQDLGRRLRELLAIPERDRSDAVWDEIIGLEIQLAPGNRASAPHNDMNRRQEQGQGQGRRQDSSRRPEQARRHDGSRPSKRIFKRPKRNPGS